jgi:ACS family glucarate transporter-like MFS transporter
MRKRYVVYGLLFSLTAINYIDRMALAIASHQITAEFDISPFMLGLLLSSFLWLYLFALIPMGMLVDRFGTRLVNAWGIGVWSVATLLSAASGGFLSMLITRLLGRGVDFLPRRWTGSQRVGACARARHGDVAVSCR